MASLRQNESGQALTEYVLLVSLIILGYLVVIRGLQATGVADRLLDPIRNRFAATYRFGNPQAKAPEDGGFKHPRFSSDGRSIRLFINPETRN
jgi:Flp pilus assembly pilin Flp